MLTDAKIRSEKEVQPPAETNQGKPPGTSPKPDHQPEPQPQPGRIPDAQTAEELRPLWDPIRNWVSIVLTDHLDQDVNTVIRRFPGDRQTLLCCFVWCMLSGVFKDTYLFDFTASQKAEIANIVNDSQLSGEDKEKKKTQKLIEYINSPFSEETSNSILTIYENICELISVDLLDQKTFEKHEEYFRTYIFGPAITINGFMQCSRSQYRISPPPASLKLTDASLSEMEAWSMTAKYNGITETGSWAIIHSVVASYSVHIEPNDPSFLSQHCESENVEVPEHGDDNESSYSDEGSSRCQEEDDSGSCYDGVTEAESDGPFQSSNNKENDSGSCYDGVTEAESDGPFGTSNNSESSCSDEGSSQCLEDDDSGP
ncbi:hypothetical protein GX51_03765 [Blastomyces parvus]|uniref:Uncharacterized protein n=1 Tax=Blastomyces parvus TaxID=2060905 RepID=A0A2B7X4W4_9EURO|nr:hypothetical protein GX51_03765 [Blastomyces parvus]